mgnify:CR=1 FL=1
MAGRRRRRPHASRPGDRRGGAQDQDRHAVVGDRFFFVSLFLDLDGLALLDEDLGDGSRCRSFEDLFDPERARATIRTLPAGSWSEEASFDIPSGDYYLLVRYAGSAGQAEFTYANNTQTLGPGYVIKRAPDRVVAGVDVGLAIKHPRISDLVIHLVSPNGTKVLLFEDRYGTNGITTSNLYANFSENTNYTTHIDTNGYAALGFYDLGYLQLMKFIPAPFSAVISPPRLFTNATNLTFGYRDTVGNVKESPTALAQLGGALEIKLFGGLVHLFFHPADVGVQVVQRTVFCHLFGHLA